VVDLATLEMIAFTSDVAMTLILVWWKCCLALVPFSVVWKYLLINLCDHLEVIGLADVTVAAMAMWSKIAWTVPAYPDLY